MSRRGAYIVLDGPEFGGKSTQAKKLAEETGSVYIREPGFTDLGAELRKELLNPDSTLTPDQEFLLMSVDRALTYRDITKPNLDNKVGVIGDRSWVSSVAYQGFGDGVSRKRIDTLTKYAVGGVDTVDLYLFLDVSPEVAAARSHQVALEFNKPDRFESQGPDYHNRIREGYLQAATELGDRAVVIDASQSEEQVYKEVYKHAGDLLLKGVSDD